MEKGDKNKVPEISIDEALQLYISMVCPQGLPEGEEGERILNTIKEKISSERPEWAKASGWKTEPEVALERYSEVKQKAIEEASKEDLPEDPEERYLYQRKQEALENSQQKRSEQIEAEEQAVIRKNVIDQKNADDQELLKRAAQIKKVLLERAQKKMTPDHTVHKIDAPEAPAVSRPQMTTPKEAGIKLQPIGFGTITHNEIGDDFAPKLDSSGTFSNTEEPINTKPDAKEWFKDFRSLSMEDRVESIKSYNLRKREMLESKEDLMWDQKPSRRNSNPLQFNDNRLDMDHGLSFDSDESSPFGLKLE